MEEEGGEGRRRIEGEKGNKVEERGKWRRSGEKREGKGEEGAGRFQIFYLQEFSMFLP